MNSQKGTIDKSIKEKDNLTSQERFLYSIALFPNILMTGIFSLNYVNFFWDNLQLQQIYFSLALIIYAVINSLNDFYLGRVSDKTNVERWGGRRLVYIKWGGPLWAFIFFAMWFPWSYTNQIIIFIHLLVALIAFDMMLSLVWLVWTALLPELTENIQERNRVMLYSYFMWMLAVIPVMMAFYIFETSLLLFQIFAGICAVICAILYYVAGAKLKERPELYVQQETLPLIKSLKQVMKERSFVGNTIFRTANQMNTILGLSFVFAYVYILEVDLLTATLLYVVNSTVVGFTGNMIYEKLSKKRDMRNLIIRAQIMQMILAIVAFFLILETGLTVIYWIYLFCGGLLGGYMLFDYPLLMLVTDDDEVIHGYRREGTIIGTNVFFIKITESIAPIFGTLVLLYFGFARGTSEQTTEAVFGILILIFIVPTIVRFFAMLGMLIFPLHGKYLEDMGKKLREIHQEKSNAFSQS
jgi:Na+/melibiose symporter-like transporter